MLWQIPRPPSATAQAEDIQLDMFRTLIPSKISVLQKPSVKSWCWGQRNTSSIAVRVV
jgi:hypothetical protein